MARINRELRARLQRQAQEIRRRGQRGRWPVERTAAAIQAELPQILPLEAWRLAYGWSRRQVVEEIQQLFTADGLAAPALNSAMLCRWEHGQIAVPALEYCQMLCRLYQADPYQLGLIPTSVLLPTRAWGARYRPVQGTIAILNGHPMTTGDSSAPLAALRDSIQLALEVEGPGGGPLVREHLEDAVGYYSLNFSDFAPAQLAFEVHQTRALVGAMLRQDQPEAVRTELRRLAGWLSALVGNLAFFLADHTAAHIHLGTAARLGTAAGDNHLICWSLGAQAMTANAQQRHHDALDLARQALEYADTPLRRAQILAWGQLRTLAALGEQHRSEAAAVITAAQDEMAADPDGELPGRFGFDHAELNLHIAESQLMFGDHVACRVHAETSQAAKSVGGPGWAAATLVIAQADAARARLADAAALATEVLDAVPAPALRDTSRVRLRTLDRSLFAAGDAGPEARDLRARIRELPALVPVGQISAEPNGL